MKEFEAKFREEAQQLHVQPPHSAWKRIESKLETQRMRRKVRVSRLLSYGAAALLLVGISITVMYFLGQPELTTRDGYTVTIVDLQMTDETGHSIYDVERARALSAVMLAHSRAEQ